MKKGIYLTSLIIIFISLLLINTSLRLPGRINEKLKANSEPGFVLMELFTSQGCSSCPPADEILGMYALKNDEHIFPLAFHVDYWNRLGWVDSLSKGIYSQRQRDYAEKLNTESIYTPQLIINGQKQMVGSNKNEIAAITQKYLNEMAAVKINIAHINLTGNKVEVDYNVSNIFSNMNINAALVQKNVITQIRAGENRGTKLNNYNVVRDFKTNMLTNTSGNFTLELPNGNNPENYMIVLFVQENTTGSIKGAARINCK